MRRGIERIVGDERRSAIDRAYEEGYARLPESTEELDEARRLALRSMRGDHRTTRRGDASPSGGRRSGQG